ncbi:MAG TPA: efflux RND transporter permease subunit [Solirubrobacteraceae bacterium]|nr:efflux RND transporter permease subunit [Solirubrobacteraceae bacterium]
MIRSIITTSLKFRLLVVAIAVGVMALGFTQLRDAPVDVLPEFTPPYAEVQTEALGLSADEVEQLITVPLEADLLNGVEGVEVIRSESLPSMSSITLVFKPGTDVYRGRQLVNERLIQAHALPNVSKPPTLLQPLSSSSRVMMIGLSSKDLSPIEKSVIARWTMRPRLMGVPGVANVAIWGMRDQELQVQVDPERLREKNVTLNQVIKTAGNAQVVSPLSFLEASTPGTGGFIETPQQRLQVRNVLDKIADPQELGKVPIDGTGGKLRLTDVADLKVDHQPLIGDAVVNDGEGLLLVVEKFPGANTLDVTRGVEAALDKLRPGLAGMGTDTSVFRPATFIENATSNLTLALIIGGVLMALILAAFLFQWRSVFVALVTIPLALTAAALVLDVLGETFNAISFAGLALAVALVVDDAVVGVENVAKRLRQDRAAGGKLTTNSVLEASREVRSPLAYATLISLLAIVPVAVMVGRPGAFFEPLALSYALAVAAAMLVALTVTPALSLLLFSRGAPGLRESPLLRKIGPHYDGALSRFMRRPRTALLAAGACVVAGLIALPLMGTSLIPSFKDRDVLVRLDAEPGTSSPRMTRIATELSRKLRAIPGVDNVGAHVGRAVTGDQIVDVNSSEVWVSVDSGADYDKTVASIENAVRRVRGVERDVVTYSEQKIRNVGALNDGRNDVKGDGLSVLTGTDRDLAVRVYGQDLAVLRNEANKVREVISRVDGVVDPRVEMAPEQPTLEIEVDLAKARRFGIKPGDVRRAEATLLQGIHVGSVFEQQKVFDVIVQGVPGTQESVESVRNLLIDRPGGGHVRLGQVADVRVAQTPIAIQREAVSRRVDVVAGVSGRSDDAVSADIEKRLANVKFPLEYHAEVQRATTGEEIGAASMLAFAFAAVIAAFLLLQAAFRSWRLAAVAFLALPVALVGGLLAALIAGAELSLGSLIGLLALFGLAARQSVVLLRHFQDLERDEGVTFGPALVQQGSRDRLAPILTTGAAVAVFLLPCVILGSRPGLEVAHPMATVILGGLVTSTFVSLFVLPALYLRVAAGARPEMAPGDELMRRWIGVEPALAGGAAGVGVEPEPVAGDGREPRGQAPARGLPEPDGARQAADTEKGSAA